MGYAVKQSQTAQALVFLMVDSSDHISPKTGLTVTVTLSKNGAAFAAPSGAVTEIGSGWYKVAGHATDSNTLGPLVLHASATGADPTDDTFIVVAFDPQDAAALGLSRMDAAISTRSSHVASDVWAVTTRAITDKAGFSLSAAGVQAIWDALTSALTTVGSVGKRIADNLDAAVSSRSSHTAANVRAEMDSNSTKLANLDATVSSRSSHTAADVWAVTTRTLSAFGFSVDISAAGLLAIWSYLLTSITAAGSIGKLIKDNIDAAVSSRGTGDATAASQTAINGNVLAVKSQTDKLTFNGSNEVASSEATLQGRLTSARAGYLDTLNGIVAAVASAVWLIGSRTLTAFAFTVDTNANATETATAAAVAALNDLSQAEAEASATSALNTYDPPTNAEMVARTLPSASYALEATLTAIKGGSWTTETLKAIKDAVDLKLNASSYTAPDNATLQSLNSRVPSDPADASDLSSLLAAISGLLTPEMANVDALATKLNGMLELSGSAYRFTVAALGNAPGGGDGAFTDEDREDLQSVRVKVETLGSGRVVVQSPVSPDGSSLKLVAGDDYLAADGRAIIFDLDNCPDLTGATVKVSARNTLSAQISLEGSVVASTGPLKRIIFEVTSDQSKDWAPDVYRGDIEATLSSGSVMTLRFVELMVVRDYTRPA